MVAEGRGGTPSQVATWSTPPLPVLPRPGRRAATPPPPRAPAYSRLRPAPSPARPLYLHKEVAPGPARGARDPGEAEGTC